MNIRSPTVVIQLFVHFFIMLDVIKRLVQLSFPMVPLSFRRDKFHGVKSSVNIYYTVGQQIPLLKDPENQIPSESYLLHKFTTYIFNVYFNIKPTMSPIWTFPLEPTTKILHVFHVSRAFYMYY